MRVGRFPGPAYDTLVEGTIRITMLYVAQIFQEKDSRNPTKDEDGDLGRLLLRQYRALRNNDPNPVQQKAIHVCILTEVTKKKAIEI